MTSRTELQNLFSFAKASKFIIASLVVLVSSTVVGWSLIASQASNAHAATQTDCTTNSIIKCGVSDTQALAAKYQSSTELQHIYAQFGLSGSTLTDFVANAKAGVVYKDGRVVVNGKTVGTNAMSLGRENIPGSQKVTIGGETYYYRATSVSFASNSLDAMVLIGSDGVAKVAVLNACGNPVAFTPVKPPKPPVTPETPVTPTTPATPVTPSAPTPEALPQTGAEATIGGFFGISSLTGIGYYWTRSRRTLVNRILRRK
jgi:LPXTG-motif cell wall-anchored protein